MFAHQQLHTESLSNGTSFPILKEHTKLPRQLTSSLEV